MKSIPVKAGESVSLSRDCEGRIVGLSKEPRIEVSIVDGKIVVKMARTVYRAERQCREEEP